MSQTGGNNGDDVDGGADGVEEVVVGGIREDGGSRSDEEGVEVEGRAESEEANIDPVPGDVSTETVFSPTRTPSRIYMLIHALLRMTLAWRPDQTQRQIRMARSLPLMSWRHGKRS